MNTGKTARTRDAPGKFGPTEFGPVKYRPIKYGLVKVVLVIAALTAGLVYTFCPRPELTNFTTYSTAYFDRNGVLLRLTLAEDERYRLFEALPDIKPEFVEATILYEDQHYYDHSGVDFPALLRAFWTTYVLKERRVGASTIVMQVARLLWDIPSNRVGGKIHQILRAIQLTRHYSKQEILEAYLNLAPYGRNIEGIGAASLVYFNKKSSELNLVEILTLAVIPQNPGKRNPTSADGYRQLLKARKILFSRWVQHNPNDLDKAKYFSLPLKIRAPEALPFTAPHYINYLQGKISKWDSGRKITTLDSTRQGNIENIVKTYVRARSSSGVDNAAVLVLNYQTMSVVAMMGSADFYNSAIQGQVNGVTAKRSPGSALKPFVYALSMDEGLVHPLSLLKDSPRRYGGFTPENYDKKFLGPISVKDALIQSRNVPAVDLQSKLKSRSFHQFLLDAGISDLREASFYGLALALGGGEVTMLELASLYAALANKGELKPIRFLEKQRGQNSKRILSKEASFLTLDILKDNPAPGELNLNIDSVRQNDIAWKTGTSWGFRDAWAVGISGPYVVLVWVGNFDGKGNETFIGRSAAGPLMFSIFESVFPDQGWRIADIISSETLNLKKLLVCSTTGDLYEKHCPSSEEPWFIPGVSPIKVSGIYRIIPIDKKTGLRACWHRAGITEAKVFEFWPSDFLQVFRQAGISLKTPPKYGAACGMDQKSATGQMPIITSPQNTVEYVVNMDSNGDNLIPLTLYSDPVRLYWLVIETNQQAEQVGKRQFKLNSIEIMMF